MAKFATWAFLVALSAAQVYAQAVYGNIVGTVLDAAGAAVPGAKVTITDVTRNVTHVVETNESGNFAERNLIAGTYRVRIEKEGFQSYVRDNIVVTVDNDVRLEANLRVGDVTQVVEVSGEVPLLKTERSDVAQTYTNKTVSELPIFNRRFTNFELITPGVQAVPGQTASSEDPQGSYRKVVNGQSFAGTTHLLDGTDNHDAMLGLIVINPTLESVTDAKVATQNYDAEFGASAGVVSSQTRSGTNQFHGSAFWFLRNSKVQARNPFTQARPIPGTNGRLIPVTQWNQFGASIGGPVVRDKLFFFGDFQSSRRNLGNSRLLRVPTEAERAGDLSQLGVDIFDPLSGATPAQRTQFPGNRIPTNRLSAQALNLLKLLPLPNTPAVRDQPNFAGSGALKFNDDAWNTRWDYFQNEKLHWFGRFSSAEFFQDSPGVFGRVAGGVGFEQVGFAGVSDVANKSLALGADYSVTTNLLTDFRFGWFRYKVDVNPGGFGTSPAADAGIPGMNTNEFTSGMPGFFINGLGGTIFGYALPNMRCNCPLRQNERQWQIVNNWSKFQGNHTFKFGADIRRASNLRIPSDRRRAGEVNFDAARTQGPAGGGTGLATFLLGDVSRFERYVSNVLDAEERQNRFFFYGQDTWRITSKLTMNYGLRWEIYRPQTVTGAGRGGFIDTTGEVRIAGQDGVGLDLGVGPSWNNFAPRLGIAYQVTPKTVIRTGYGRGYDIGVFGSIFGHNVTQNLPVLAIQSEQPAQNFLSVFTLAQGPQSFDPAQLLANARTGPNGRKILPDRVTAFILPQKLRLPTTDQWNFTIQHQLPAGIVAEAGYVGTKGTHVFAGFGGDYDFNQPTVQGFGTLTTNQRKPFFNRFGWSQNFRYYGNDASNNYHALQLKAEKRFSRGFSLLTHYTWGRAFNYTNTYYNQDATLAYGPNDNQRDHVFYLASLYEIPVGKGRRFGGSMPRAADIVLGGWQINNLFSWSSGLPFTPSYRDCNADRDTGWCRPDVAGDVKAADPSQFGWFATSTTPLVTNGQVSGPWSRPARGTFGNVGRNRLRGPNYSQWDFSLFKTVNITERANVQLRVESYNFANKMNLGQPNGCVDCPGVAGRIFDLYPLAIPRTWQFGMRFGF
ncbi:MAG: TonB-dependent receptor [Bryobacteraceae bacterium]|nr:TonB-dependent receptor [Bryobacteraceae bacterium]